jgi:hypothetical protein
MVEIDEHERTAPAAPKNVFPGNGMSSVARP